MGQLTPAAESFHNFTMNSPPTLAKYMLVPYTMALILSATMCCVTCIVVFKWDKVRKHTSHGTLFMFFACTVVWCIVSFIGCIARYLDNRTVNWGNDTTRNTYMISMIFQVGSAIWLILAVYEIKRMVFNPRSLENSQRVMKWMNIIIFSFVIAYGLSIFIYFQVKWGRNYRGNKGQDATNATFDSYSGGLSDEMDFFNALKWVRALIRGISVIYPVGMCVYFYMHRHEIEDITDGNESNGHISQRQVQLIMLLNSLVTVPICLSDTGHFSDAGVFMQLAQFSYHLSGAVSAFAIGNYLPRFDQLLKSGPRRGFHLLQPAISSSEGTDIYILEARRVVMLTR
ncbi:hypothetical protein THRCLA_06010 [Thraustotheca clavata]|uniref:Uncharacterized protein n=1 Tax=Thraustotheca clavata TaxID=74557 RepID=A0A1V9ZQT0_9STRA|nr:hypothetical protein THRCLA_06010 [Thraustotheca clavata]